MRFIKYFKIQLKNALFNSLRVIVVTLFLILVMGGVFLAMISNFEKGSSLLKVDVVLPPEDKIFSEMIKASSVVPGIDVFFSIEVNSYDEAMDKLKKDEADVVAVIPDEFFSKAESMQDTNFDLFMKKEHPAIVDVFISFIGSIQKLMGITEGAILTMYDGMREYGMELNKTAMEDEILHRYVYAYFTKDAMFEGHSVSAYGEYSVIQYYLISFLILAMGISFTIYLNMYDKESRSFELLYSRNRAMRIMLDFIKLLAVTIVISIIPLGILYLSNLICVRLSSSFVYAQLSSYFEIVLVCFSMAVFVNFIGRVFENSTRLIYILTFMLLALCSGAILPTAYLPEAIRGMSRILPFSFWHNLTLAAFLDKGALDGVMPVVLVDVLLLFCAFLVPSVKERMLRKLDV